MFSSWLRRITGGGSRLEVVERLRHRVFETFYEYVKNGRLKSADAHTVWERLEHVELQRRQVMSGKLSRQNAQELTMGYNYLADYVGALSRALIQAEPPRTRTLHPQRFQSLYNAVASGLVSCEDLKQGACVRRLDPEHALHSKLWGSL